MDTSREQERVAEKYRALFESNLMGVVISDLDEKILEANDMFLSLVGYSRQDLHEEKIQWSVITPKEFDDIDQKKIHELLQHGSIVPFEKEYIHKDGHPVPVLVGAALIRLEPPLSICFALDISKQKQLEKKKDEFVGTVSHELRAPLAVMKSYTEILALEVASGASNEKMLGYIKEIDSQINQLATLIQDMLTSARYGEDTLPERQLFDLQKCIRKEVSKLQMVHARDIVFLECDDELIVQANLEQIMQVTRNLVMNAVQYSRSETRIVVSVFKLASVAKVCVQDFGIGISSEVVEHIFERHYRAQHADAYAPEGAGIGLHISKEIIDQHHGTLSVQSTEGEGSTFCYTLPLVSTKNPNPHIR